MEYSFEKHVGGAKHTFQIYTQVLIIIDDNNPHQFSRFSIFKLQHKEVRPYIWLTDNFVIIQILTLTV